MKPTALSALLACALAPAFVSAAPGVPDELASTRFSGPDITPCPACLCAAPTGEVFVGVDLNGSLGKGPGKGRIVRLIDKDNDGKADAHTVYAEIDNPRGLISVGKKLFVLHTVIPKDTGKLEAMHLSVLEDADWDGKADGEPKRLISNISVAKHNQDRGADHTTNGIQLGIDGWIYVAVGDFGYVDATGADGTKLTMLGGGVVRVRPDGSEFEVYTHGLRNIYDIAIDPLMNIFTRGNTNDGGGWNVRFIHHIQTGEYGYPVLFKNFTSEMLPALQDLGGGSGTGALYFQEPGWPAKYSDVPMMCDWGRSQLYIHRLEPDGPSFTQAPEDFLKIAQISDVEVDGSGRLYAAAWDGAGYKGSEGKGYVDRIVPTGWSYQAFPEVAKADAKALVAMLRSDSATARRTASQELISRPDAANAVAAVAVDSSASLYARVAAIFTYKQMLGDKAAPGLLKLAGDKAVREWAIRALTDRKTQLAGLNKDLFVAALKDENPRVQVAAAVALGRLGDATAADALLAVANPPGSAGGEAPEDDNAPAFATEPFSGYDTVPVEVDVTGWDEMFLTVTDGGDGSGEDHAAWFNPVFVNDAGKELKLSTLKWKKAESEWGKIGFGTSAASQPLKTGDGKDAPDGLGTHAYSVIVFDVPKGAVTFKADAGIASTSKAKGKIQFMVSRKPVAAAAAGGEGPHATPNSPIILPHIAVKALVDLQAVDACVEALGGPDTAGALWALRKMHDAKGVDGLISACGSTAGEGHRASILAALIRLYQKEAPYDGSWWWSTRPDTRGPY
ncbi:MAG: NPCBM/NEW2 domain-containing protein, partial [Verrucomicrobiales bacterium]